MSKSQAMMRKYRRSAEAVKGYEKELIERLRRMPVDPQRTSLLKHWDESERKMPHGKLSPKQWHQVLQHAPLENAIKTKTAKGDTGLMVRLESLIRFATPDDECGTWLAYFRRTGKLNSFQKKAVAELIKVLEERKRCNAPAEVK